MLLFADYENENQEGENYIDCTNLAEEDRDEDKVRHYVHRQLCSSEDSEVFQQRLNENILCSGGELMPQLCWITCGFHR